MSAGAELTPQQKREVLNRILASRQFQRSERLSSFLRHICELELAGRSSEINERDIGTAVFQLQEDFDPTIDGIVRSHASRLRRKLELYYLREGAQETVRIFIPRGGYHPRFVMEPKAVESVIADIPVTAEEAPVVEAIEATPPQPPRRKRLFVAIAASIVIACAATLFAAALWKRTHTPPSVWDALFTSNDQTLIVAGDTSLVMWEQMQRHNISLPEYLTGSFAKNAHATTAEQSAAATMLARRYTSVLDLDIVQGISSIAWNLHQSPQLRYARDIRPNDLKDRNAILIGSAETNPWVHMFEDSMNFVLVKDQDDTTYTVKNRHPLPGEPAAWRSDPADKLHTAFCKVTFAANGSEQHSVLLLEGTSTAGTECAWEFLSDAKQIEHLRNLSHAQAGHLPHFEVLLRTSNLGGDATSNTIVASRILP